MLKLPPSLIANEVTSILPTSLKAKALHDDLASVGVINVDTDSSDEEDADECDSNDGDLNDFDSKSKRQKLEEYCLDDDDDILIIEEKQVSKNGGAPAARSEATTATKLAGKPAIPVAPKVKVQKMKGSLDYQPKLYNTGSPLDPASQLAWHRLLSYFSTDIKRELQRDHIQTQNDRVSGKRKDHYSSVDTWRRLLGEDQLIVEKYRDTLKAPFSIYLLEALARILGCDILAVQDCWLDRRAMKMVDAVETMVHRYLQQFAYVVPELEARGVPIPELTASFAKKRISPLGVNPSAVYDELYRWFLLIKSNEYNTVDMETLRRILDNPHHRVQIQDGLLEVPSLEVKEAWMTPEMLSKETAAEALKADAISQGYTALPDLKQRQIFAELGFKPGFDPLSIKPSSVLMAGMKPEKKKLRHNKKSAYDADNYGEKTKQNRPKRKASGAPVVLDEREMPPTDFPAFYPFDPASAEETEESIGEMKVMKLSNGESILYCADLSHGNVVGGVRCLNLVDKTAPAPIEWLQNAEVMEETPADDFVAGCRCQGVCLDITAGIDIELMCSHVTNEDAGDHGMFAYLDDGRLRDDWPTGVPIYECNTRCTCDEDCRNRVVQRGSDVKLEVFKTLRCGWGIRALHPICKGTFVTEYIGEVLNEDEADRRGQEMDAVGLSYLFDVNTPYGKCTIDASRKGNHARYFNHSCAPNLHTFEVCTESLSPTRWRIAFFAKRNILAGEELTFDYHYPLFGQNQSAKNLAAESGVSSGVIVCHCLAKMCRKILYAPPAD